MNERLQKYLSRSGVASRRAAEQLIEAGRVKVNGMIASLGDKVTPGLDQVLVDDVPVAPLDKVVTYLFNKPRGVLSSRADRFHNKLVTDFVPKDPPVYPAGRLDKESEGLLILTNDGELANIIMHPSKEMEKEYLVMVNKALSSKALKTLKHGILIDGICYKAKTLSKLGENLARVVLTEGKKRMIRVMFKELGYEVERLVRVRIGPIHLNGLKPGEFKQATFEQIAKLYQYK